MSSLVLNDGELDCDVQMPCLCGGRHKFRKDDNDCEDRLGGRQAHGESGGTLRYQIILREAWAVATGTNWDGWMETIVFCTPVDI